MYRLRLLSKQRLPLINYSQVVSRRFTTSRLVRNESFKEEFAGLSPDQLQKLMDNPLVSKIAKSSRALEALQSTVRVLDEKGYMGNMGMMKQIQLLMDKDVKKHFLNIKTILEEEGIELKQEDIAGLTELINTGTGKKQ